MFLQLGGSCQGLEFLGGLLPLRPPSTCSSGSTLGWPSDGAPICKEQDCRKQSEGSGTGRMTHKPMGKGMEWARRKAWPEGPQNWNRSCFQSILVDYAMPDLTIVAVIVVGMISLGYGIKVMFSACLIYQNKDTSFHLVLAQPALCPYPKYLFAGRVAYRIKLFKKKRMESVKESGEK